MEYKATQKFLVMSPRKMRFVVQSIKGMHPARAAEVLPFMGRNAAIPLSKVIKSALANAKMQGAIEADLVFKEIQVGEGPRLKRGKARSRGMYHPRKKRMSHIRVVLTTNVKKVEKELPVKVQEKKEVKTKKVTKKGKK